MVDELAPVALNTSAFTISFLIIYGWGLLLGAYFLVWSLISDDPGADTPEALASLLLFLALGWLPAGGVAYVIDAML